MGICSGLHIFMVRHGSKDLSITGTMIIYSFLIIVVLSAIFLPLLKVKAKGIMSVIVVLITSLISSYFAVAALSGKGTAETLSGSLITGPVEVVIDPLSAWFILLINFTFITSVVYGARYLQLYREESQTYSLHWINFIVAHISLLSVCIVQNAIVFLVLWEIMALSTFMLVIFEGKKKSVISAGINYLIQSHVAILFLTIAFLWSASATGSYDFKAISVFAAGLKPWANLILMLLFFIGFGIKSGFVPFHTWLPHAHPAAPSHVSGMMSGVLIKIGIYGILRMILLVSPDYIATGYFILIISVITGIYGVMLAIVQHNLKRLLAYHSIENIGIIGIGIGLGCLGLGSSNTIMATLGFTGALLHTLNHSLFKSLLFYAAGNVYRVLHSMNIEKTGGLIRSLPRTAILFLVGAIAICGLPPFNGFVSEFIIYLGLFSGTGTAQFPNVFVFIFSIMALALIGGLAILCFTKAFGIIFLGEPRSEYGKMEKEKDLQIFFPMYLVAGVMLLIGLFPQIFINSLALPVNQLTGYLPRLGPGTGVYGLNIVYQIGFYSLIFLGLAAIIFFARTLLMRRMERSTGPTWGCGYNGNAPKTQYTASSFVRSYRKLAGPILLIKKNKKEVKGIFPGEAWHHTHPLDKIEEYLINRPVMNFQSFLMRFSFLQNGKLQFYLLYGLIFIGILVFLPLILSLIKEIFVR